MNNNNKMHYGGQILDIKCPPGYEYNPNVFLSIKTPEKKYETVFNFPQASIYYSANTCNSCIGNSCTTQYTPRNQFYQPNWDPSKTI